MQDELKLGALILADESASPLPLEQTQVEGTITGAIAAIQVTQRFGNPFAQPIDLEYLFPLPHEAAVVDYEITIGSRTIKAEIKEAKAAQQAYQEAVEQGKRASLLEQRRPNLFAIQIGNVQPGETIITRLRYEDRLHYEDGAYEFIFPMGITPRYHSPAHPAGGNVDAPVTLDDSAVSPVEISLTLDAGVPITAPTSHTHSINTTGADQQYQIALAEKTIPNKDFVLRYNAAISGDTRAAIWSSANEGSETAVITLLPPPLDLAATPASREFIFVVDRSGSMGGEPMEQAKNALRACVRALNAADTFMVQTFDDQIEWFEEKPLPLTQANVTKLDSWLNGVSARGGTEIMGAIKAALAVPAAKERQRYVVFLTDGAVSADDDAIRQISKQRGAARIFTFGIGPSVNRYLLAKMAQLGRGAAEFVGAKDDLETTITRFQDKVSYPVMYDLKIELDGAEQWDTYPAVLPDLYIGEPLEIVTKIKRKKADVTVKVSGTLQNRPVQMSASLPSAGEPNPTILRLWARARIEALMDEQRSRVVDEKTREQIISLALEHRIVTAYTSFVAVDSEVTAGSESKKVKVAVPLPEGLEAEGFFGGLAAGGAPAPIMAAAMAPTFYRMAAPPPSAPAPRAFASFDPKGGGSGGGSLLKRISKTFSGSEPEPKKMKKLAEYGIPPGEDKPNPDLIPILDSLESRLKWLVRIQRVDGGWDGHAEMTAVALLAFVRAGHTTRAGHYRSQVKKAAEWLTQNLATLQGFDLLIAIRALHELHVKTGDYAPSVTPPAAQSDLERAAQGEAVNIPTNINSVDDLRITALVQGATDAPDALKDSREGKLVEVWLAVGKP